MWISSSNSRGGLWYGREVVKDPSDLYIYLAFRSRWYAVLAALFAQVEGKQSCNIPNRLTGNHARLVGCWWNTPYNFLSQCLEDCVCTDKWPLLVTACRTNGAPSISNTASQFSRCTYWSRNTSMDRNCSSLYHYIRESRQQESSFLDHNISNLFIHVQL